MRTFFRLNRWPEAKARVGLGNCRADIVPAPGDETARKIRRRSAERVRPSRQNQFRRKILVLSTRESIASRRLDLFTLTLEWLNPGSFSQ
jgi:hypothetical protein